MGMGDDIMFTAKLKRLKLEHPDYMIVPVAEGKYSGRLKLLWSPVYSNNPYISKIKTKNFHKHKCWKVNVRPRPYTDGFFKDEQGTYSKLKPHSPKPGELYFTDVEIERAKKKVSDFGKFIYIEPNIKEDGVYGDNKDWGFDKWQAVVNSLPDLTFVQAYIPGTKVLENVNCIITINVRKAFAILSLADHYVGSEGGMHHAAAALHKKSVVVFGGVSSPNSTGYNFHTNLYVEHPESPCGRNYECDHCKECMEKIEVQDVTEAIDNLLRSES